ncbi:DoxX family protein [Oceanimonas baumannii]|uniref:DoxX family protein n=1 Tax=Oceanimonas baumannii TaxID=129578 RepID=UPI003A8ED23A
MSLTHTICTWRERLSRLPYSLIALLGRFSIAAVFWRSGQTKVDNFSLDVISGEFSLGWPSLNDSAVFLFREEYRLPFISPELGALLAATAEHVFPLLLVLGLASRISALSLLGMTLVIQVLVYPGAWPLHGVWATVLLLLAARGPGVVSLDHWLTGKVCD